VNLVLEKKNESQRLTLVIKESLNELKNQIEFRYQNGEIWNWISENRNIFGEPWDWEYSRIPMHPGIEDLKNLDLYEENEKYYLRKAPRPYLRQYINETASIKSSIKCRQSEATENEINTNLFFTNTHSYFNVRHLFPTAGVAKKVAEEKINIAVETSPKISRRSIPPRNITKKHFLGNSFYTVDGAFNEFGGRGPSSDRIVYDEYNFHNSKIKEIYASSTDHSRYGGQQIYISTPTFPGMGIDVEYQNGCQYSWHFKCPNPKCGLQQVFLFPGNVINFIEKGSLLNKEEEDEKLNNVYLGCRYCKTYINKTDEFYIKNSRWIAKYPIRGKTHASYAITGMMLPWRTGRDLNSAYLRMRFVNQFYNEKVGVSYIGDSTRVQKEQVEACQDFGFRNIVRKIGGLKNLSFGIDWGDEESWLICIGDGLGIGEIANKMRVILALRIAKDTLLKYGIENSSDNHVVLAMKIIDIIGHDIIINDANGVGIRDNAKLYKKYKDKSFGSFYDTTEQRPEVINKSSIQVNFNEKQGIVTIPRTVELTASMESFIYKDVLIPLIETKTMWTFVEHIHALASNHYYDDEHDKIVQIVGHIGPDHFAHAYTLARIGYEWIKNRKKPQREEKSRLRMSR